MLNVPTGASQQNVFPVATILERLSLVINSPLITEHTAGGVLGRWSSTANADGIRHAMLEVPNLKSSDAKFMLVACSAFTNYIVSKAAEASLKL